MTSVRAVAVPQLSFESRAKYRAQPHFGRNEGSLVPLYCLTISVCFVLCFLIGITAIILVTERSVEEVPDRTEGFGRRGGSGGGDAIELAHHSPTDTHCYSEGTGYHTTSDFVSLESYSVYRRCCDDYYYQAPDTDYTKYETTCDYHTCDSKQNTSVDYSPHDSE
ncbi:hypothetical protein MRX96_050402 [Rhipicephalus microplus]